MSQEREPEEKAPRSRSRDRSPMRSSSPGDKKSLRSRSRSPTRRDRSRSISKSYSRSPSRSRSRSRSRSHSRDRHRHKRERLYKIYVGNLSRDVREKDLEYEFDRYGDVASVWISRERGRFGFVEMYDRRDADDAIYYLDGVRLRGSRIEVEWSKPNRRRSRSPRGRTGGRDEVKCFNCNQFGHIASACKEEKNKGECYVCHKTGHQAKDCPDKR